MSNAQQNIKIQKLVCTVAVALFVLKTIAYYYTHSVAILTDALESIVNVVSGFFGLYSVYISALPKDRNHPYGHGKIEFISAAIEATLILLAGGFIIYESFINWGTTSTIYQLDLGIGLIAISAVVNYTVGFVSVKNGRKNNSLLLVATGKHLQSDTYTTLGILIGLFLIKLTNIVWIDNLTAIVFAFVIIYTGIKIMRESIAGIMDESDEQLLSDVVDFLNTNKQKNWIDLHNLRIIKYGSVLHLDCHLTVPWYFTIEEGHVEVDQLEQLIKKKYGSQVELFVHLDGCKPFSCLLCDLQKCPHRKQKFQQKVEWTVDRISTNKKHQL